MLPGCPIPSYAASHMEFVHFFFLTKLDRTRAYFKHSVTGYVTCSGECFIVEFMVHRELFAETMETSKVGKIRLPPSIL